MNVGDVVILRIPLGNESRNAVGIVVNDTLDSVQIVFEKGHFDVFSADEQELFLKKVGHDSQSELYNFQNPLLTIIDFESGFWDHVFSTPVYNSFKP